MTDSPVAAAPLRCRRVFGPEEVLPLLTGGSNARSLWRPGGWHSATENPIPLQGKKNSPGPRKSCYGQPGPVTCPGLSFPFSPSNLLPFTHLYVGLHSYFPSSKYTGIFFKTSAFFQVSPEPVDPCQQSCGSLPECKAAAGPTPGGTVSPSVYTFLRAIALGRLCESGTQPGAVLVTLKFLLQFCQI